MRVPFLDLARRSTTERNAIVSAMTRVLDSGQYILGEEVAQFEALSASFIGCKHAIGVSSGTDALLVALMAMRVGAGDEIICPSYTFFATAGCVARLGATPVFADIDPLTYTIDPIDVGRLVTAKTKAIIPVHLFGYSAELGLLDFGAPIVEDAAQAIGATMAGAHVGAVGKFATFSFFPSKNLGTLGDAGLITTNDDDLAEEARMIRGHGAKPKYHHHIIGGNFRMDALHAAVLSVKLPTLTEATTRRQHNARVYDERFAPLAVAGCVTLPSASPHADRNHTYHQYVIRIRNVDGTNARSCRDHLREFLVDNGVQTEVYYPVPLHLQPCFAHVPNWRRLPASECAAKETLALPIFPELTDRELNYVADVILRFFESAWSLP